MEGQRASTGPTLGVLGPLVAWRHGEPIALGGPKQRLVLGLLATRLDSSVSAWWLMAGVWEDDPPTTAKKTLQGYVHHLRTALGDVIETTNSGYRLRADRVELDASRFARTVEAARAGTESDPAGISDRLRRGLALWRGPPYADVAGNLALDPEIHRLNELRMEAIELRIDADLAGGAAEELIGELESLTREYPMREKLCYQLMLALYRSGRQADALRAYQHARTHLVEQLGLDPSPQLRDLEERILRQDPALARPQRNSGFSGPRAVRGYELREVAGRGPVGVVHRAFQTTVGREVALKAIDAKFVDDPAFVETFDEEAKRVAALDHPHILSISDAWREPGAAYHVSRWMSGGSLSGRLADLDSVRAIDVLDQVGSALSYAHRRGVAHGRVKPSNVLFDDSGAAKLVDFGVRGVPHEATGESSVYLAPELAGAARASAQADIFSFGVLAGALLDDVPTDSLRSVLERATHTDPLERYEKIDDLLRNIRRAVGIDVASAAAMAQVAEPRDVRNPYKGLRAFQEADSDDFFGREDLVAKLVEAVDRNRLVAVVGPSGSGKSSVVKAGLIPTLRRRRDSAGPSLLVTEMFPGSYPFEELEAALLRVAVERPDGLLQELTSDARGLLRISKQILPDDDGELLLMIDQFEELFSVVSSEETRSRFLDSLLNAVLDERSRISVVLTLRADFFDRPLEYSEFGEVMRLGLVTVSTPDDEGLARAIAGPARSAGLDLEPGLVTEIVRDVTDQPGGLPLMQYALTEMFRARESDQLTFETYRSIGGVLGALGTRAEALYQSLGPRGRRAIEQTFLRLVTIDEGAGDLRRRVRSTELMSLPVDQSELDSAIRKFGAHRLLSFDRDPVTRGPTIEVAHEALLREWDRFHRWVDDQREDLLLQRQLSTSAREWEAAGRDRSYLLRGGRLEHFETWANSSGLSLTRSEQAFLDDSRNERTLGQQRDAKARRRLRRLLVGVSMLALLAAVAGLVANSQRNRADEKAQEALDATFAAETRRLVADAPQLVDTNRQVALLLAAEAFRRDPGPETLGALQQVLVRSHGWLGALGGERAYGDVTFLPDGRLAALRTDGLVVFDDAAAQTELAIALPSVVAVSEDGSLGAVVSNNDAVVLLDMTTLEELHRFENEDQVLALDFSVDGRMLAIGDVAGWVEVWDVATSELRAAFLAHPETEVAGLDIPPHEPGFARIGVRALAFSDDGSRIVTGGMVFARVHEVSSGRMIGNFEVTRPTTARSRGAAAVRDVDFEAGSSDVIAAATEYNVVRIDLTGVPSPAPQRTDDFQEVRFPGRSGVIAGGAFVDAAVTLGEDHAVLALAGGRRVTVIDRKTGATVLDVDTQHPGQAVVALSGDGTRLAVGSEGGISLWSLDGGGLIGTAIPREGATEGTISEDGRFVVLNQGGAEWAALWEMRPSGPVRVDLPEGLKGMLLGTQYGDHLVAFRLEDTVPETSPAVEVLPHLVPIDDLDAVPTPLGPTEALVYNWSPNSEYIAFAGGVGGGSPVVNVFSIPDGAQVATVDHLVDPMVPDRVINSVGFDATADRMLAATSDGAMLVWDTTSWQPVSPLIDGGGQVVTAKFTPDGRHIATISQQGRVLLRHADSLQPDGPPLLGNTDGSAGYTVGPYFTADGRYMITTSDGRGRLWDLEARQQIGGAFPNDATGIAYASMDGRLMLTLNGSFVTIWDLDVSSWFDVACRAAGRNLAPDEWEQFGPSDAYHATCDMWPSAATSPDTTGATG